MSELSEDDWERLCRAWELLHPGAYPDRSQILEAAFNALEAEATKVRNRWSWGEP